MTSSMDALSSGSGSSILLMMGLQARGESSEIVVGRVLVLDAVALALFTLCSRALFVFVCVAAGGALGDAAAAAA